MTRIAPIADVKARLSAYIEESQTEGPVVNVQSFDLSKPPIKRVGQNCQNSNQYGLP